MTDKDEVVRVYAKYVYLDVVQFSRRSAEAQSEIVNALNSVVHHALESFKVTDDDRILIPTGDGLCAALIDPHLSYDAHIQLALLILRLLHEQNAQTQNETRRFQVRIGINQNTDILIVDINGRKNVAGAGVNMASRIMDQSDGGQILVGQAVYHELQPSEAYMDKFRMYNATGKHNISFQVYQYYGDDPGLNTEAPSAFVTRKIERKKLSEQAAHYFAQAIVHRSDLLRIKATTSVFWENIGVILLKYLADDAYRLSKAAEFEDPPTTHVHGKTFDEQFAYYQSQDSWVRIDAEANIIHGDLDSDGLSLASYSDCFEYGYYQTFYAFLNRTGIERLKEEWPGIWKSYDLDRFLYSDDDSPTTPEKNTAVPQS